MERQNNCSLSNSSSFSSSPCPGVDALQHKENHVADEIAFVTKFDGEFHPIVGLYWEWTDHIDNALEVREYFENRLRKLMQSSGKRSAFTDMSIVPSWLKKLDSTPASEHTAVEALLISSYSKEEGVILRRESRKMAFPTAPVEYILDELCADPRRLGSWDELRRVSDDSAEGLGSVASEFGGSEQNDTEGSSEGRTPSTRAGSVIDKGKQRASLVEEADDSVEAPPHKRKRVVKRHETLDEVTLAGGIQDDSLVVGSSERSSSNRILEDNELPERLCKSFLFSRFGFRLVSDPNTRFACPFSDEYALENGKCDAQFDADAIEPHISEHINAFEEKREGEALGCPLYNLDKCKWGSRDRSSNSMGPNYDLSRHVCQVHLRTRKTVCPCGATLSRDGRQELARHLRAQIHKENLKKQREKNPALPFYPDVNDESIADEERVWNKKLVKVESSPSPSVDDRGEGSSRGVKRKHRD